VAILTSADWPAVRDALDTELDTNSLLDATIARNIYSGAADQDVLALDPDAETRTGEDANRIQRAAVFFCAARLAPVVLRILNLSALTRDLRYSKPTFDPDERANELRGMAVEEINEVLVPGGLAESMPRMFSSASGTRGK
jgi:hypothetical protein